MNNKVEIKDEDLEYIVDDEGFLCACKDEFIVASFNDRVSRWHAWDYPKRVPFGSEAITKEEMLKRTKGKYPKLAELLKGEAGLNKIMFEMTSYVGPYQLFVNIDENDIVEYEFIDHTLSKYGPRRNKDKLDKRKSKIFIDLIEKAKISEIPYLIEEFGCSKDIIRTDVPIFSISSFKYGSAKWDENEEIDNAFYIYLAIGLCDAMGLDTTMFSNLISGRIYDDVLDDFLNKGKFKGKLICYSFDWTNYPSDANPYDSCIENIFDKEDEIGKKIENIFKTQDFNSVQDDVMESHWNVTLVNDSYEIFQYYGKHGENKLIDELIEYLNSHDYTSMVN